MPSIDLPDPLIVCGHVMEEYTPAVPLWNGHVEYNYFPSISVGGKEVWRGDIVGSSENCEYDGYLQETTDQIALQRLQDLMKKLLGES